jgi:hypothetical protein
MEVITTTSGLQSYGSSYPYTISYMGMQRKASFDAFHPGHISCINAAKAASDKILIGFTDDEELADLLFPELNLTFGTSNKEACLAWAANNDVDIVFWPDPGEMASWFDGYDINALKSWASTYCTDHGFVLDDGWDTTLLHVMMILDKIRQDLNLERRDSRVGSWKDGTGRLYHKYYIELEGYYEYILTPSLLNPETLIPYGYVTNTEHTLAKAQFISQIPNIISTHKSLISTDITTFQNNVKSDIDALDVAGEFYTIKTNVYYNQPYVESGYAFIELVLHLDSTFSAGIPAVEGRYVYSFYVTVT